MNVTEAKQLSVIIPHYNAPTDLRRLLQSIPSSAEVIVVDDKSNQGLDVYEQLKCEFPQFSFYHNETTKKGAGVCRNLGIEKATGKWVIFADADDYFTVDFETCVSRYFETEEDLVYFTPTSIDSITKELSHRHLPYEKLIKLYLHQSTAENELFLRYGFPAPWSKMIRRHLIIQNQIRFDEVRVSEDYIFSTKIGYYAKSILAIDQIIYTCIERQGSLSKKMDADLYLTHVNVFIGVHNFLRSHLSTIETKTLDMAGIGFLFYGMKHRIKYTMLWRAFRLMKKNKIPLLKRKYKNPLALWEVIKFNLSVYKEEKGYYVKSQNEKSDD